MLKTVRSNLITITKSVGLKLVIVLMMLSAFGIVLFDRATPRLMLAIMMIIAVFGIALIDWVTPGASWKITILGVLYGFANIVIFVIKD